MRVLAIVLFPVLAAYVVAFGGDWPGWRGDGSGIGPEAGLPLRWDTETNIAWKTPMPGKGNSSPVVHAGRIFLTAWDDAGRTRSVLCLDAKDGKLLWQRDLTADVVAKTTHKNGYASSTAVVGGVSSPRVFAFFDSPGLVALDPDGKLLWTRPLGPFKSDWGMASSPILYKDSVVQVCDDDGGGFIVGVDAVTGEVRWRTPRPDPRQYATPILIEHQGKPQIVVNGMTVVGYEPATGRELWRCRGMNHLCSPSAVYADGVVYAASGRNGPAMAIDPGGSGDVTETHVRWFLPIGGPYVVSPIVCPLPCLPGDNGHMRFVGPDGSVVLEHRLGGHFTASPVGADGKLYWTNELGKTHVLDVSQVAAERPALRLLATNPLGERVYASPAIADGRLYIRTSKSLFCIAGGGETKPPAVATTPRSFAELKKQYDEHPAEEGEEVIFRIQAVEALAEIKGQESLGLLRRAALEDPHWDVSEAAAKALGAHGEAALPVFLEMSKASREYLRVLAARQLGELKAASGAPALIQGARDRHILVRIHSLRALAQVAPAHAAEAGKIIPALMAGLNDKEGVVKQAAIEALASLADKVGGQRDAVAKGIQACLADPNPLVAAAARKALRSYKAPPTP
ncbi:MAG TPA: PQQ-binding-like beta-propeller repeat protein [Planctomycetota bacterium]|nr:PQQ-binding-like beta-propeller repeat protein [Planctomycetota bacterium]